LNRRRRFITIYYFADPGNIAWDIATQYRIDNCSSGSS
jgi:hypothetical protein